LAVRWLLRGTIGSSRWKFEAITGSQLDPYTVIAQNDDVTLQEKLTGLASITKSIQTAMFTSRSADGQLHSRAMTPASPSSDTELDLYFIANSASHKFEEIQHDPNVNAAFYDPHTTEWASYAGKARVIKDRALIQKYWTPFISGYFGDLKDGIHKGDVHDPRVTLIELVPDEIRYWVPTKGTVGRAIESSVGAVTGRVNTPGQLRTISKTEIQLAQSLHHK